MAQIDFLYQYYCECLGLDPANETTALENQCVLIASKIGNEITFNDETRASIQSEADEIGITYNMCLKAMLVEGGMDELLMINVTVSNGDTFDTALLNLYSYQITEDRTYTFETELQDGSGRKGEHTVVVGQEGSSVTNPYEENGWEMAWTYSTEDGWSDMIAKGTTLDENIDIVAKFYKTGNTITPQPHPSIQADLPEGPEYKVVIEGKGLMGTQYNGSTIYGYCKNNLSGILSGTVNDINAIYPSYVTEVYVCDGIESIGEYAFRDFTSLTQIHIPNTVKIIDGYAFGYCSSLTDITLPSNVEAIGENTFYYCTSFTDITIPSNVKNLGESAFEHCEGLKNVVIENNSITTLEAGTFSGCTSLTNIIIPYGVTTIGRAAFSRCESLTSITIPESVTNIEENAFRSSGLTSIVIPSSVTSIGESAFSSTDLTSIVIPASVETLGADLFISCEKLETVTITSNKIKVIEDNTFRNCTSLTSITIPEGVTKLYNTAFYYCTSLKSIYLPSSLTENLGYLSYMPEDVIIYVPNSTVETLVNRNNANKYTVTIQ